VGFLDLWNEFLALGERRAVNDVGERSPLFGHLLCNIIVDKLDVIGVVF